jgi:hypothetical protein
MKRATVQIEPCKLIFHQAQMTLPGSRNNPDLVAARFLLKPGRRYEEAVKTFEPYDKVKEENPEARAAGRARLLQATPWADSQHLQWTADAQRCRMQVAHCGFERLVPHGFLNGTGIGAAL